MKINFRQLNNLLDKAIEHEQNVMLSGRHGMGKTAIIKQAFEKAGLKYQYFSAATMDPFVDFIGCPKERKDEETGEMYLDLVRPKQFANDEVEAIFLDEYNRAPKKVRNAVMELIQFKSINGKKFNNLKVVWTAINPAEDEYDVDVLDGAQKDRFHIFVEVPNELPIDYFTEKFGVEVAKGANEWWTELPEEIQRDVSPRRLEYALEGLTNGMSLNWFLPKKSNTSSLKSRIKDGPILAKLEKLSSEAELEAFFDDENNWLATKEYVTRAECFEKYVPYWPKEKIAASLADLHKDESAEHFATMMFHAACINSSLKPRIQKLFEDIASSDLNKKSAEYIRENILDSLKATETA